MTEKQNTTVYVIKHALGDGGKIARMEAVFSGNYAKVRRSEAPFPELLSKDFYSTSEAEALQMAEAMRAKKIASLRKQILKLEAMKFKVVAG